MRGNMVHPSSVDASACNTFHSIWLMDMVVSHALLAKGGLANSKGSDAGQRLSSSTG